MFLLAKPDHTELGPHKNSRRWFGQRYALELDLSQGKEGADEAEEHVEAHPSSLQAKPPRPQPRTGAQGSVRDTALYPRTHADFSSKSFFLVLCISLNSLENDSQHADWSAM